MIPNNTRTGHARRLDGEPYRVDLINPAAGVNWSSGAETFSRNPDLYREVIEETIALSQKTFSA